MVHQPQAGSRRPRQALSDGDTIVAVATAPGRGAVGILRLSGTRAADIAAALCGPMPPPRTASLRDFRGADGQAIDRGLVLYFRGPASFTGEDVVELQGHGGPVLLEALQQAAVLAGARRARAGEFSERAFLNGCIDLAQAEAIADLIGAQTLQAARAAQRSLDGAFSDAVNAQLERLIAVRSFVEGALDFSDEDVDWLSDEGLNRSMQDLRLGLAQLLSDAKRGSRLRDGLVVVIAGRPNVGKSTLLNRLAGRDAAIVTEIAGTTRDVLREDIAIDGLPLTIVDTAGLRETDDPVEREGVRRAWNMLEKAELVLFLVDDREPVDDAASDTLLRQMPEAVQRLLVYNKCDLSGRAPGRAGDGLRICARSGAGLDALRAALKQAAGLSSEAETPFSARARHVEALQRSALHVARALDALADGAELAAEELRLAQSALSEITGAFSSDDLLGRIFSNFCIGK